MTVACAATQWIYLVLETDKERAVTVTGSSFSSSITPVTFVGLEYSVAYATTSTKATFTVKANDAAPAASEVYINCNGIRMTFYIKVVTTANCCSGAVLD
jgi:hypothetical protein